MQKENLAPSELFYMTIIPNSEGVFVREVRYLTSIMKNISQNLDVTDSGSPLCQSFVTFSKLRCDLLNII